MRIKRVRGYRCKTHPFRNTFGYSQLNFSKTITSETMLYICYQAGSSSNSTRFTEVTTSRCDGQISEPMNKFRKQLLRTTLPILHKYMDTGKSYKNNISGETQFQHLYIIGCTFDEKRIQWDKLKVYAVTLNKMNKILGIKNLQHNPLKKSFPKNNTNFYPRSVMLSWKHYHYIKPIIIG
jgi:hypothetical protein